MHHHLEEGDGGDPHILKVIGITLPGLSIVDSLLLGGIVGVEGVTVGINQLDVVVEL
jgi:hypothetical protein